GTDWFVFEGATQPSSWHDHVATATIRVSANVTHSAGVLLGTPGGEDGLAICDANGRIKANITAAADGVLTAPKFGPGVLPDAYKFCGNVNGDGLSFRRLDGSGDTPYFSIHHAETGEVYNYATESLEPFDSITATAWVNDFAAVM